MTSRRSVRIARGGKLELFEEPQQALGPCDVRVRVAAIGINFADILMRQGLYPEAPKIPFVPGYEIAGTIAEIGAEARGVRAGDRVLAGCRFGGYTSEIVLRAGNVRKIPDSLSFEEAAAIPVAFLTAWIALEEMSRIRKGDRVAIHSAAGGVGLAAVQVAARAQARVTGLIGSTAKANSVMELGAEKTVLTQEWQEGSDREWGNYDIILDAVGGAELKRSMRRIAPSGRVVSFGVSTLVGATRNPIKKLGRMIDFLVHFPLFTGVGLMMKNQGIYGLNMLKLFEQDSPLVHSSLDQIVGAFQRGEFKANVGKTFPLDQATQAHDCLMGRGNIGKVVLIP